MQAARDQEAALVEVVASILACSDAAELFERLTKKLSHFVHFEDLSLLLYDETRWYRLRMSIRANRTTCPSG